MDLDNYENFLFHQKVLEYEANGDYLKPLMQIKHMMDLHPKDIKWIVQVSLDRHLSEHRLVELAREYLHVNIEIRILGHRQDVYGDLLLSCIVRRWTQTVNSKKVIDIL